MIYFLRHISLSAGRSQLCSAQRALLCLKGFALLASASFALASLCTACQSNAPAIDDSDLVEVRLKVAGYYGAPFSDLGSRATGHGEDTPDYDNDLKEYTPHNLPDGSLVWASIKHSKDDEPADLRSFVVRSGELYPCQIHWDENGDPVFDYQTNRPIYLKRDHEYDIKIMGPARQLTTDGKLYIENGQEVYSHDSRYEKTSPVKNFKMESNNSSVTELVLKPVIQQTAKLKFTIKTEGKWEYLTNDAGEKIVEDSQKEGNANDPGYDPNYKQYWLSPIHDLGISESGVVITGLQEHYSQHNNDKVHDPTFDVSGNPWNWQWDETYLLPFPGEVRNYMTLTAANATVMNNEKLVLETCILPCDATATPIIVGFYLRVNGVPTQFEMMLNRKMFLHGYQYHYLGTLKIEGGITVLEWQTIIQELEPITVPEYPEE